MSTTKKLLQTVAVAGAVTATGAIATTAHADTNTASSATTQSNDQLGNLKQQQTASETAMASANQATMDQATSTANDQIAKLNDQLKSNQAKQAAGDRAAYTSGSNAISQAAQSAVNSENAAYSSAAASQSAANSAALADAQSHIVTSAQQANQRQAAKDELIKNQQTLDASHKANLDQLKKDHDQKAADLNNQIKAHEATAQQEADQKLKNATSQVDGEINQAQADVNSLQNKVNQDSAAADDAQAKANSAQSDYNNATEELNSAIGQSANDFIPLLTLHGNIDGDDYDFDTDNVDSEILKDTRKVHYTTNEAGVLIASESDMRELTIWAANVLNELRKQVGSKPVHVSEESIAAATEAMKEYNEKIKKNGGSSFYHDDDIYNNVSARYNLDSYVSSILGSYYDSSVETIEFVTPGPALTKKVEWPSGLGYDEVPVRDANGNYVYAEPTMGETKVGILGLLSTLIHDEGVPSHGHRNHLLGLHDWSIENVGTPYFGLGQGLDGCSEHVFISADGHNQHEISLNTNRVDTAQMQEKVNNAKTNLDNANAALASAKNQLSNDQTAYTNANNKLNDFKNNRDAKIKQLAGSAVTDSPEVANLKNQLKTLDDAYNADVNKENADYQAKLQKLQAAYDAKIKAINAEPTSVAELQKQLDAKMDQLQANHEAKLAQIKADAQKKLDALKEQIKNSHPENIAIEKQIDQIKADLANKQAQLDQQLANLKAKDAAAYAALAAQLNGATASAAVKGNSNAYTTKGGQVIELAANDHNNASREASKGLPQTGNTNSAALIALGAVTSMFSFGLIAKKRF